MRKFILLYISIFLAIISCQKKINSSTPESLTDSIKQITESLDGDKKTQFQNALQLIIFSDLDLSELLSVDNIEKQNFDIHSKINGMTADEVINTGEKIKQEIERKKKEQAKLEITEIYAAKEKSEADKKELNKFKVLRSRFYKEKQGTYYVTEEPIIELTVKNDTDHAISRAYFSGTIASPERSVPWLKEDFNYEISGGLEPNEKATWKLAPNPFSNWGTTKAPKNAIFTVEVTKLDDANGDLLYSINSFGAEEKERLNELLKSYPEFKK